MNGFQQVPCPRCGSPASVHSIQELAALARAQLGQLQGGIPAPGQPGGVPGYLQEPVPGQPGGVPGYLQEPRPGPSRDPRAGQPRGYPGAGRGNSLDSPGDELAALAMSEAAKFIGRRIGRRMQRTYADRVQPALAAQVEQKLQTQITIAERHPDICACLDDNVVFLAASRSVLPMPDLNTLTVEQADAMVAALRQA